MSEKFFLKSLSSKYVRVADGRDIGSVLTRGPQIKVQCTLCALGYEPEI